MLLCLSVIGARGVELFPFGPSQSDDQLARGDEEFSSVTLSTPFIFSEEEYTDLTVSVQLLAIKVVFS